MPKPYQTTVYYAEIQKLIDAVVAHERFRLPTRSTSLNCVQFVHYYLLEQRVHDAFRGDRGEEPDCTDPIESIGVSAALVCCAAFLQCWQCSLRAMYVAELDILVPLVFDVTDVTCDISTMDRSTRDVEAIARHLVELYDTSGKVASIEPLVGALEAVYHGVMMQLSSHDDEFGEGYVADIGIATVVDGVRRPVEVWTENHARAVSAIIATHLASTGHIVLRPTDVG
jgi:hypothetical protein